MRHSKNITGERTSDQQYATSNVVGQESLQKDDEGWKRVVHRRKPARYRYRGVTGIARDNEGRFKAAVKTVPILITKVHKDTAEKDIEDYVYKRTKMTISLQRIISKHDRDYNAFKFFVTETNLPLFLDSELWPEGVIFRRFVHFQTQKNKANGVDEDAVNGGKVP